MSVHERCLGKSNYRSISSNKSHKTKISFCLSRNHLSIFGCCNHNLLVIIISDAYFTFLPTRSYLILNPKQATSMKINYFNVLVLPRASIKLIISIHLESHLFAKY